MSRQKLEIKSANELAVAFLKAWETELPEDFPCSKEEMKAIKCSLYTVVTERYARKGEMFFTSKELQEAVAAAQELVRPTRQGYKSVQSVNQLCVSFVSMFLENWKDRSHFTEEELSLIFAHLYAFTVERYESSHSSILKFTKRELKTARDFVMKYRSKKEREAKADERDRRIRAMRARFGSAVEDKVIIHE